MLGMTVDTTGLKDRWSIRDRLSLLCLIQIALLAGSTFFLTKEFSRVSELQSRNLELISVVKSAHSTHQAFGDLKYWLSDLAVSLLMQSEHQARAAQSALEIELDTLEEFAPDAVNAIRGEVKELVSRAMLAVDAYSSDERVLGNSHMARTRAHIAEVGSRMNAIVDNVERSAFLLRQSVEKEISEARLIGFSILVGGVVTSIIVALFFLVSITRPLGRLAIATKAVSLGNTDIEIPENAPDEIGEMAESLRVFRDNLLERDRAIEEKAKSEARLENSKRFFQGFLDNSESAVVLKDPDGRLMMANRRWHEWYNPDGAAVEGEIISQYMAPEMMDAVQKHDQKVLDGKKAFSTEADRVLKDGGKVRLYLQKFPVMDEEGAITAIGTIATDVTDFRRVQNDLIEANLRADQAAEANKAMTDFLANMSHELRTPLNAIIGFADVMCKGPADQISDDYREFSDDILMSGKHLLGLINELLDTAKIENGELEIAPEDFPLMEEIDNAITLIDPQIGERSLLIEKKLAGVDDSVMINADRQAVRQIVLNLLSNAEKFSPSGGTITVEVGIDDGDLDISVRDRGIGIAPENLDKVFDRFFQIEGGLQRSHGGTGIGLPISRALAELHGGSLTLESQVGAGTLARLVLPGVMRHAAPAPTAAEPVAATEAADGPHLVGRRILLAEDHKVNQALMRAILRELGHEVEIVENGQEAVAAVMRTPYDLVFMDMQMPELDGVEAATRIRALQGPPSEIPIVALTANAMSDQRQACLDAGMNDHVSKPVDAGAVQRAVDQWALSGPASATVVPPVAASAPAKDRSLALCDRDMLQNYIQLVGPDSMADIMDQFFEDSRTSLDQAQAALTEGNFTTVESHIHSLKGAFASLGAIRVAILADGISAFCRAEDKAGLAAAMPEFQSACFDTLEFVLAEATRPAQPQSATA